MAGATATGKSAVAQLLAEQLGCAILSADSMAVYKGMDIGTAKPGVGLRGAVPYYGIDLTTPDHLFSVGQWRMEASQALQSHPGLIVSGGTGLYIKALTNGLEGQATDPALRHQWLSLLAREGAPALRQALDERAPDLLRSMPDSHNPRRLIRALEHLNKQGTVPRNWREIPGKPRIMVLRLPREQAHVRIQHRVEQMYERGLLEEVENLRERFPRWSHTASHAIGYAEAHAVLDGVMTRAQAIERTVIRTRQLAKRQETWFRHQFDSIWIDILESDSTERVAERLHKEWSVHGPTSIIPC